MRPGITIIAVLLLLSYTDQVYKNSRGKTPHSTISLTEINSFKSLQQLMKPANYVEDILN